MNLAATAWPCWTAPDVLPREGCAISFKEPLSSPHMDSGLIIRCFPSVFILRLLSFPLQQHHFLMLPRINMWKAVSATREAFQAGISDRIPSKKYWAGSNQAHCCRFCPMFAPGSRACLRIKHYPCLNLITHKLVSCICNYSWLLSHLVYNNNFKGNVLEKEMNKHKTFKRGKLMWDFRQVICHPFCLCAIL